MISTKKNWKYFISNLRILFISYFYDSLIKSFLYVIKVFVIKSCKLVSRFISYYQQINKIILLNLKWLFFSIFDAQIIHNNNKKKKCLKYLGPNRSPPTQCPRGANFPRAFTWLWLCVCSFWNAPTQPPMLCTARSRRRLADTRWPNLTLITWPTSTRSRCGFCWAVWPKSVSLYSKINQVLYLMAI